MATAQGAPDLRPLRVGEILDVGIKVYTRNAKTLFKLVALVVVPIQIIGTLIIISTIPDAYARPSNPFEFDPNAPVPTGNEVLISVVGQVIVIFLQLVSTTIASGACFKAVSDAYLGQRPEWRQSMRYALQRFKSLLWIVVLSTVATLFGLVLCFLPGIWLAIVWAVATPVLLTEGVRGTKALARSFRLVQARFWPSTGVLVVAYLIQTFIGSIIGVAFLAVLFTDIGQNVFLSQVLNGTSAAVASILGTPFLVAVIAVLYFDLRVRTEGFDLQLLAQRMGTPHPESAHAALLPPPVPQAAAYPAPAGGYPPGVPLPPPYVKPPTNGFAIASLICGIFLCLGSIPAVILGHIALGQLRKPGHGQAGRGLAMAGTILGWVGTGVLLLILIAAGDW